MEKYLKHLHPIHKNTSRLIDWDTFNTYIDYSTDVGTLHPHTEWAVNFYRSKYFQNNNKIKSFKDKVGLIDNKDRPLKFETQAKINLNKLAKIEESLSNVPTDKVEDFMLKSLDVHSDIFSLGMCQYRGEFQYLSRFAMCKPLHIRFEHEFNEFKETVNIIKKYNKTGILNLTSPQEHLRTTYHEMLGVLWGMSEIGLGAEVLEGIEVLLEFETLCGKQKRNEDQFWPTIDLASGSLRRRMTLLFVKSNIYKGLGDDEERIKVLKEIINLHPSVCDFRPIHYYVGLNRLTEAALSLYKLQPTNSNKNTILEYYKGVTPQQHDLYESPRERALLTFEILKTFGKIE